MHVSYIKFECLNHSYLSMLLVLDNNILSYTITKPALKMVAFFLPLLFQFKNILINETSFIYLGK